MAGNFAKVRGTVDLLPASSYRYQQAEQRFLKIAQNLGFREIRVPTFEKTALFCRSSGETSDVVSKEMYSFTDKGGDELTLRPEGTAGVVRSAIENADVILAKGQANFETMVTCGYNVYYNFLCKCDRLARILDVPLYTGMFLAEKRMGEITAFPV